MPIVRQLEETLEAVVADCQVVGELFLSAVRNELYLTSCSVQVGILNADKTGALQQASLYFHKVQHLCNKSAQPALEIWCMNIRTLNTSSVCKLYLFGSRSSQHGRCAGRQA